MKFVKSPVKTIYAVAGSVAKRFDKELNLPKSLDKSINFASSTRLTPVKVRITKSSNISRGVLNEAFSLDAEELIGKRR